MPEPTETRRPTKEPKRGPTPTPRITPSPTPTNAPVTWELVWSDEFDTAGAPNPSKWDYEEGLIRNNEAQYYTRREENARVEDGMLVIEGRKEDYEGAAYTSASLVTRGKAEWTYGRFEVRAKLPTGRGTWPAIWMLGANIDQVGWPECGEIDIMENVGFDPDRVHVNIHTQSFNHVLGTNKGASKLIAEPYNQFHVYAVEWFADHLDFYVDEDKLFTFWNDGSGKAAWPYDAPHYLILNLALGGSWGGMQGIDDTIFPLRFEIDYVRVYQAAP
jgi:beta-glucanase (GH16 family)